MMISACLWVACRAAEELERRVEQLSAQAAAAAQQGFSSSSSSSSAAAAAPSTEYAEEQDAVLLQSGCQDVAALQAALRARGQELATAQQALKKDEEMFVALASEMQELAWANTKMKSELKEERAAAARDQRGGGGGGSDERSWVDESEGDSVLIGDETDEESHGVESDGGGGGGGGAAAGGAGRVAAGAAGVLEVPAKAELSQEQRRWQEGQRRMKQLEVEGRESESQFRVQHTMLRKRCVRSPPPRNGSNGPAAPLLRHTVIACTGCARWRRRCGARRS
jgi:hypothetical protein